MPRSSRSFRTPTVRWNRSASGYRGWVGRQGELRRHGLCFSDHVSSASPPLLIPLHNLPRLERLLDARQIGLLPLQQVLQHLADRPFPSAGARSKASSVRPTTAPRNSPYASWPRASIRCGMVCAAPMSSRAATELRRVLAHVVRQAQQHPTHRVPARIVGLVCAASPFSSDESARIVSSRAAAISCNRRSTSLAILPPLSCLCSLPAFYRESAQPQTRIPSPPL